MAVYQTLKLTETGVDNLTNTSKVKVVWKSQQTGESHNDNKRTAKYWITANGVRTEYSVDYTLPANTTETILSKTFTIPHAEDGTGTVKVETWMDMRIWTGVVEMKKTLTLTPIARASTIGAADAFIESTAIVIVNRKSEMYSHSVEFSFGSLSGFLNGDGSVSQSEVIHDSVNIPFAIPVSFYEQIKNKPSDICTLTCRTYEQQQQIGQEQAATFTVTAKPDLCRPEVAGTVVDINLETLAITGDPDMLIQNASIVQCSIFAEARKGAAIVSKTINGTPVEEMLEIPSAKTEEYILSATDSRGYTTNLTIKKEWVSYISPSIIASIVRTDPTSGGANLTVSGKWYPGKLGKETNQINVFYELDGAEPVAVPVTVSGDSYSGSIKIEGLTYYNSYYIPVSAADLLGEATQTVTVKPGIPVFDWGKNDFSFNVPVYYLNKLLEEWFLNKSGDTMQGILNMGGNRIVGLPEPVHATDVVTKSYADKSTQIQKVWENENPSQAVGKQTLEVDLSGFQMVAIEYQFNTTTPRTKMAFGAIGSQVALDFISKEFNMGLRICVPYANKVEIQTAAYSASSADPDKYMIPTRIFGIKGIGGIEVIRAICGTFVCGAVIAGQ